MSKVVKLDSRRKKLPAARAPGRKIGRDLFAVLVIGLCIGASLAWSGLDAAKARLAINDAAAKVQELASGLPADGSDPLPVSSIGDQTRIRQGKERRYPICGGAATRANCVVDGDTFRMDGITIRISDIDAPETHPPNCAYEADLGDRATTRLSQLLSAGAFQLVRQNRDTDRYGRQLRAVVRDGRSIGRMLVDEGLARTWTGKRRPWCPDGNAPAG